LAIEAKPTTELYPMEKYNFFACMSILLTVFSGAASGQTRDLGAGGELLDGMCDLALERFGYMAPTVLEHWGLRATEDFGNIVFNLVETGLLGKSPQDSLEDFRDVFDLREELRRRYTIDPSPIEERPE